MTRNIKVWHLGELFAHIKRTDGRDPRNWTNVLRKRLGVFDWLTMEMNTSVVPGRVFYFDWSAVDSRPWVNEIAKYITANVGTGVQPFIWEVTC